MDYQVKFAPLHKSIRVNAGQAHAFKTFVAFRWWPKGYSILPSRSPQMFVSLEPRVGGRWFERGEDGSECDWGEVLVWDPPNRLVVTWQVNHEFQPSPDIVTEIEVMFVPDGVNATEVKLEHRHFERLGDAAEKARLRIDGPNGWSGLLEKFAAEAAATA